MDNFQRYLQQYGAYIEDIRRRLYRMVILFCIIFIIGFFTTPWIIQQLVIFFKVKDATIVATSPFQLIDLAMDAGFFLAAVIMTPLFVQQLYAFLHSALLEDERRLFVVLLPIALALFITGFAYGFIVMYFALGVIATMNVDLGIVNLWDISLFIHLIVLTSTLLGVLFEFPLVVTLFIQKDLLTTQFLRSKRRHAYIVILIFVILLPPTDGLSDILLTAPLLLIYELTILLNSLGRSNALIS